MYKLSSENLGKLFNDVYTDLNIPPERFKEATQKYEKLGAWLNQDSKIHFNSDSVLYVQGSALLGTLTKPINNGEYDFDYVYRRLLSKDSVTQQELKKQVGDQLRRYIQHLKDIKDTDIPTLEEGKRCWRLQYKGKFHMDILPAIPDPEPQYLMNPADGVIITDKELTRWQFTNPKGYHSWFKQSMRIRLDEARIRLAKSAGVEVEKIPENEAKTTLQIAIQILKRHRDSTYTGHPDDKPISIIINTLAGLSYNNSENIYQTLSHIVKNMAKHIEMREGTPWVQNPINHKENFADKWKTHPIREKHFRQWLKLAEDEFTSFENETNTILLTERLEKSLRLDSAKTHMAAAHKRAGLSAAATAVTVKTDPWSY